VAESSFLAGFDLNRRSSAQDVADQLREMIFSGELPPGSSLREQPLSEKLGVSRQTVREALQWLARDAIVEHLPYRGTTVRRLTAADVQEVTRIRELIEMAALDAALDDDKEHHKALEDAAAHFDVAQEHGSRRELIQADGDFHRALVGALESPRIAGFYSSLLGELSLVMAMADSERWPLEEIAGAHRDIAAAVASSDRSTARRLLRRHLERSLDDALRAIAAQDAADSATE
jgi:DNA-binding GntR family transcriptional regulator